MRKINNNYLGDFYIETLEDREEKDRVKLYDSDENYLDYLPLERYDDTDPTIEEQYNGYVEMLESFEIVPDLMNWLVCDYDFIGNKDQTNEYIRNEPDLDLCNNEWVNRIGDIYVVISEY